MSERGWRAEGGRGGGEQSAVFEFERRAELFSQNQARDGQTSSLCEFNNKVRISLSQHQSAHLTS